MSWLSGAAALENVADARSAPKSAASKDHSEYYKKYRAENKEKLLAQRKKWIADNKEYSKEYNKKWYVNNKEKIKEYKKEYQKKWYMNNKEKLRARYKKYYAENKEQQKTNSKKSRLKNIYGITPEQQKELFELQGNCCPICKTINDNWYTDHDHVTGKVRGILCRQCNFLLGNAKDSKLILLAAIEYLEKSK